MPARPAARNSRSSGWILCARSNCTASWPWDLRLTGLVLAVAYAALTWPSYTAESQIYIQPTSAKIMDPGNNAQRWPYDSNSYDSFIQQQVQLASNPDVLVSAMQKLPAGSWQRAGESEQAAAERLGGVLKVERLGSSYQVAITAQAKSAEMAADIANAVANSIVEKAAHEANAGDTQRLAILQGERDRVQNQLNADLTEQDALNKQLGMAAVGTEAPDLIDNAIGSTREELIKARTDHDEAEARFVSMGAGKGTSSAALDAEADELVASDPGLTSMKTSLNARRATLITQMANLTPNNPEYKLDAEELNKINASLDAMMKDLRAKAAARIQEKLRTDLERTSGVEAQLNGQLRQLAATAASATPKLQRANDLATDIVRLRTRYAAVDEELHDIMLQDSVPGAVHLSVAAVPPLHPSLSGILRKSVPLALGGILLGLLAALLANHLDPRVYIGSDVEHLLGFAPMAALPDFEEVPEAVFEEHILRLATAIEHARKQGSLRTCIFTGTGAGTGVTTVVTRVRDMLASMGRPTVLVNATGTVTRASGGSRASGQHAQDGAEKPGALTSERGTRSLALLRRVTEESGTQDESLVLADTAPLLISAETEYLARFVDCAIVVVESGATTRAELRATADALQRLNVSAMGLVLNRVGLAKADAAFRNSVRGVETHLRLQGRANQRPASRPRHFAEETAPVPQEMPQPVRRQPVVTRQPQVVYPPHPVERPQPAADRMRAEQREAERMAAEQSAMERFLAEQAEADRLAAERAALERMLAQHAEADRLAAEQASKGADVGGAGRSRARCRRARCDGADSGRAVRDVAQRGPDCAPVCTPTPGCARCAFPAACPRGDGEAGSRPRPRRTGSALVVERDSPCHAPSTCGRFAGQFARSRCDCIAAQDRRACASRLAAEWTARCALWDGRCARSAKAPCGRTETVQETVVEENRLPTAYEPPARSSRCRSRSNSTRPG